MTTLPQSFWPELVRELVAEKDISYRQLCRDTGTNRTTLIRWLNGSRQISVATLETLLAYLGHELTAIKRDNT